MTREDQIHIDRNNKSYVCHSCDERFFSLESALVQHCRTNPAHKGEWCERCRWLFVDPSARTTHLHRSSAHALCPSYDVDAVNQDELSAHRSRVHRFCVECQTSFSDWREHRTERHNCCRECGDEFTNLNNLIMVSWRMIVPPCISPSD